MKNLKFKIVTGIVLLTIASMSCSKYCDDEDYRKDPKPKEAITSDSLKVSPSHPNET